MVKRSRSKRGNRRDAKQTTEVGTGASRIATRVTSSVDTEQETTARGVTAGPRGLLSDPAEYRSDLQLLGEHLYGAFTASELSALIRALGAIASGYTTVLHPTTGEQTVRPVPESIRLAAQRVMQSYAKISISAQQLQINKRRLEIMEEKHVVEMRLLGYGSEAAADVVDGESREVEPGSEEQDKIYALLRELK